MVTGEEGNINEPAEGGATALHYAVSGGHEDCVRVLLQFGADINSITTTEEVSNILTSVYNNNIHDIVLPSVVSLSLILICMSCSLSLNRLRVRTSVPSTTALRKMLTWQNC